MPTRFEIKHQSMPLFHTFGTMGRYYGMMTFWGVAAGTFVTMLMSPTPIFKKDILLKVPLLSSFYEDTTPASDKPF